MLIKVTYPIKCWLPPRDSVDTHEFKILESTLTNRTFQGIWRWATAAWGRHLVVGDTYCRRFVRHWRRSAEPPPRTAWDTSIGPDHPPSDILRTASCCMDESSMNRRRFFPTLLRHVTLKQTFSVRVAQNNPALECAVHADLLSPATTEST